MKLVQSFTGNYSCVFINARTMIEVVYYDLETGFYSTELVSTMNVKEYLGYYNSFLYRFELDDYYLLKKLTLVSKRKLEVPIKDKNSYVDFFDSFLFKGGNSRYSNIIEYLKYLVKNNLTDLYSINDRFITINTHFYQYIFEGDFSDEDLHWS